MNPSGPGLFLVGRLLIAPQLQPLLLVYSSFQLLPGLGLGGCKCQGIYNFFQVYWFMYIELFAVVSDCSLYFCGISGDIPFIIFLLPLFDSSLSLCLFFVFN